MFLNLILRFSAVLKMISDSILQIFGLPHLHMNKINGLLYSFIILVLQLIIINNHSRQARVLTTPPLSILSVCFNPACLSGINLIFFPV